ncbi:hypothetical protein DFQ28_007316, partial [Apophysomyces sp. BC1034]
MSSFTLWVDGYVQEKRQIRILDGNGIDYDIDVGWHMVKQNSKMIENGKYISKICLGAVQCSNEGYTAYKIDIRPKSTLALIKKQLKAVCVRCHSLSLEHIGCLARVNFKFEGFHCTMIHQHNHTYKAYDLIHAPRMALARFREHMLQHPAEEPLGLIAGTSPISQTALVSVDNIHPYFSHQGRVKYHRGSVLQATGQKSSGLKSDENAFS